MGSPGSEGRVLHPLPADSELYTRSFGLEASLSQRYACLIPSSAKDAMEIFARMFRWHMPTPADIMKHGRGKLQERDIIVSEAKVDLTKGDQNPMDNVSFFDYPESTEKKTVPRHHISAMFPECNRVSCPLLLSLLPVIWYLVLPLYGCCGHRTQPSHPCMLPSCHWHRSAAAGVRELLQRLHLR